MLATLLYCLPTSKQDKDSGFTKFMDKYLYQNWSFFAPPPDSNNLLYYNFYSSDSLYQTVEVLIPIANRKRANYFTNNKYNIIDYHLNGSIESIKKLIVERIDESQYKNDSSYTYLLQEAHSYINNNYNFIPQYLTIAEYGLRLCSKSIITEDCRISFSAYEEPFDKEYTYKKLIIESPIIYRDDTN